MFSLLILRSVRSSSCTITSILSILKKRSTMSPTCICNLKKKFRKGIVMIQKSRTISRAMIIARQVFVCGWQISWTFHNKTLTISSKRKDRKASNSYLRRGGASRVWVEAGRGPMEGREICLLYISVETFNQSWIHCLDNFWFLGRCIFQLKYSWIWFLAISSAQH